jgi:hypothetical protein
MPFVYRKLNDNLLVAFGVVELLGRLQVFPFATTVE